VNNYSQTVVSLMALRSGRIGIWKCWFLWREENLSTRRKTLGARTRTNNKLNPHMTPRPGIEPGPHWWKASALIACSRRSDSGARAKTKASERAGKNVFFSLFRSLYFSLALHYLNAWNRLVLSPLRHPCHPHPLPPPLGARGHGSGVTLQNLD